VTPKECDVQFFLFLAIALIQLLKEGYIFIYLLLLILFLIFNFLFYHIEISQTKGLSSIFNLSQEPSMSRGAPT